MKSDARISADEAALKTTFLNCLGAAHTTRQFPIMKNLLPILLASSLLATTGAQVADTASPLTAQPGSSATLQSTPQIKPLLWQVGARDECSTEHLATEQVTNATTGAITTKTHRYVQVGAGLNYLDDSGQYNESKDLIELMPDGSAAAIRGPTKVHFDPNINTAGAVSITTRSNRVFKTHILGLYWYSPVTGNRSLISLTRDSMGELLPPNQIVYRSAFASVRGSIRFTCTRAGLESDIVLEQNLSLPDGFSPDSARLEVWHEYIGAPTPARTPKVLQAVTDPVLRSTMVEPDLTDDTLDFGDLWLPLGCGFSSSATPNPAQPNAATQIRVPNLALDPGKIPVAKHWVEVNQRSLLIESVPWSAIRTQLSSLPQASNAKPATLKGKALAKLLPPPPARRKQTPTGKAIKLARVPYNPTGVLLDYIAVSGNGDYTFDTGNTYFVHMGYFGGTVTLQPNCVIKEDGSSLLMYGTVVCNGTYDSPSIVTTKDDDLFGESLPDGSPTYNTHRPAVPQGTGLWMYWGPNSVSGVKVRWAASGVVFDGGSGSVSDSAFEICGNGIGANDNGLTLNNVTMCAVGTPVSGVDPWALSGSYSDLCAGDSDGNGLPDAWEFRYFNRIGIDPNADPDGDGLSNMQEYQAGTDPTNPDTDYDGRTDGQEIANGTNPIDPTSVWAVKLVHWTFDDSGSWLGDHGQAPTSATNLSSVPTLMTAAVVVDNPNPALLQYREAEANGSPNINCQQGSIRFLFSPDWSSTALGGAGPGSAARLIEIGSWNPADPVGWWSLCVDPGGNQFMFITGEAGNTMTNLVAPISWVATQWHQIVLTYTPTDSSLWIDLQLITNGSGVAFYPNAYERTASGLRVGSDATGNNQARGAFDELETFNFPLSPGQINRALGPQPQSPCTPYQPVSLPGVRFSFTPPPEPGVINEPMALPGTITAATGTAYCNGNVTWNINAPTATWASDGWSPQGGSLHPQTQPSSATTNQGPISFVPLSNGRIVITAGAFTGSPIPGWGITGICPATGTYGQEILFTALPPGRLAYWSFDYNLDGDGNQDPSSAINVSAAFSRSPFGQGLNFDSPGAIELKYPAFQNDAVTWPGFANLNNPTAWDHSYGTPNIRRNCGTICFWFKPNWTSGSASTSTGTFLTMLSGWTLSWTQNGSAVQFSTSNGGTPVVHLTQSIAWTPSNWYHVAVTYSVTNTVLYVNGQQVATGSGIVLATANVALGFRVGSDGGTQQARGILDELETFNCVLSPDQISSDYLAKYTLDSDGDGLTNLQEFARGSDPNDPNDPPPSNPPPPSDPNDTTPPTIQLLQPINATPAP
ncbi:MAG TPA: LamG-like jellyroll fold domain-containing protein [Candidatus Binatia bacterium]|jgi:hypothetical protein|nr:LamG-like jellyroll fold domain-containing protein [Candidatus Binatia bacterium]